MVRKPDPIQRVETFGCRLNAFESQIIREHLGPTSDRERIIFNTCAVTAEAERQARQAVRRARRANPKAEIVVTGCAAQVDPKRFAEMPEVDRVVGNEDKLQAETWAATYPDGRSPRVVVSDIMDATETVPHLITGLDGRTRAFVQVQQGCDHRCTFCIIPYGRGNSRSVPIGEVVRQASTLVENGHRELVLTGVDITSYGGDLPGSPNLGQMARRLLASVPELPRLRFSSIDPMEVDEELLRLFAEEPRLMPHLHLSVQAGDDLVLKRMKRRHTRDDLIRLATRLRNLRPDIVLGADFITGFPTENETMFKRSLDLIEEAGLVHLHVFPYSAREGTPAARMPQVPAADRKERAARLRALGKAALASFAENRLGRKERVLVEHGSAGLTEQLLLATLKGTHAIGTVVEAIVTGVEGVELHAEPAATVTA
ncbi:MAG: tRNA (N(6)-L-threonylcarbamoyladenosine(37)-C(2))-methylthiotransferase MtaB [Rhodospirillaceae bacterium]|nr:tRNA (N(6)-L-threonylcarbamoyladenosine(37)-C(2))-methylthiotransferase MtaB [Rhodospirillaceae bacterium]